MSLSGALSNAVSGLNANALGTSVLSANIANALNEHYGRREVTLTTDANQSSGGVRVAQIERFSSPLLNHQKRLAISDHAQKDAFAQFSVEFENLLGSVDTLTSVSAKLTEFETSLLSAASDPSSEARLHSVAHSAAALIASFRSASDGVQTSRTNADHAIGVAVSEINQNLSRVEDLNGQIMTAKHLGQDTLTLLDQRDALLDQLSEYVPLHVVDRESGAVSVFSAQGRTLLDGSAVQLNFETATSVLPHMTVQNGLLSQLSINEESASGRTMDALAGGRLAALFEIRDNTAPEAQAKLDAIARDMIERFGPGGPDTTILAGNAGMFTDGGAAFTTSNEVGIAGRVELNSMLEPSSDELWRWRDGLYAATIGEQGDADLLIELRKKILAPTVPSSANLGSNENSLFRHVQDLTAQTSLSRVLSTDDAEYASTQLNARKQALAENGVNTDNELQKLIALEKSYAANARVVQVVDDMLAELLRI